MKQERAVERYNLETSCLERAILKYAVSLSLHASAILRINATFSTVCLLFQTTMHTLTRVPDKHVYISVTCTCLRFN
jgi:hypothetical protein